MQSSSKNNDLRHSANILLAHWHHVCRGSPKIWKYDRSSVEKDGELSEDTMKLLRDLRDVAEHDGTSILRTI